VTAEPAEPATQAVSTRRIIALAASAFVVLAAEPLFVLVDTAVVGHLGRVPLAALGASGTVMTLLAIVGSSLEYGTTGRAARYFGAGRRQAAVNEGVQASWLAFGLGLIAVLLGELLAGPVVGLVAGHHPDVAHDAERSGWRCSACRECCWCLPATDGCAACRTPGRRSGS
jgi:Na+-driven multidrug efflux pump